MKKKLIKILTLAFISTLALNAAETDTRSIFSKLFGTAKQNIQVNTKDSVTNSYQNEGNDAQQPEDNDIAIFEQLEKNHECEPPSHEPHHHWNNHWNCDYHYTCDDASLTLKRLCTCYLKAWYIWAKNLYAHKLCAKEIKAHKICAHDMETCNLCAKEIKTKDLCANGNITHCTNYKAWLSLTTTYTYQLGDIVAFDTSFDPNGDVSGNPAEYVAPKTGWYIISLGFLGKNLTTCPSANPILGNPVIDFRLGIDGEIESLANLATLGWTNKFGNHMTTMVRLHKGAHVHARITMQQVGSSSEPQDIEGTIELVGSPTDPYLTQLSIHYLSSDCPPYPCEDCHPDCPPKPPCPPCPPHPCPPHPPCHPPR